MKQTKDKPQGTPIICVSAVALEAKYLAFTPSYFSHTLSSHMLQNIRQRRQFFFFVSVFPFSGQEMDGRSGTKEVHLFLGKKRSQMLFFNLSVPLRFFSYQSMVMALQFSCQEGRPGISDVSHLSGISGLSFDSTFLSALVLPSPVAPSVFSFSCLCPSLLSNFQ